MNCSGPKTRSIALDRLGRDSLIRLLALIAALALYSLPRATAADDYDRAIAEATERIRIEPNNGDAFYNRGLAWDNKGEYDKAIADFNVAIRLNPNDPEGFNGRGLRGAARASMTRRSRTSRRRFALTPRTETHSVTEG